MHSSFTPPLASAARRSLLLMFLLLGGALRALAQDPGLPPTNLGISNMLDGAPRSRGVSWLETVQLYQARGSRNAAGDYKGSTYVNTMLAQQQITFISEKQLLGGYMGFSGFVPIVKFAAASDGGTLPLINPNSFGDLVLGPTLQWFDRKLFGLKYMSRLELNLSVPVGSYDAKYAINPSAHLYNATAFYAFTVFLPGGFAISSRQHLNRPFHILDSDVRPGMFYNFNYSLEKAVTKGLRVELAGYYLKQLTQDAKGGDTNYYQTTYGISDTRERVFAYGAGLSYGFPSNAFLEFKVMNETAALNRSEGVRGTLRLIFKLSKVQTPPEPPKQ